MYKILFNLLALFAALIPSIVSARQSIPEYGKIDKADLLMTECPFDKSANAMVLLNTTAVDFSFGIYNFAPYITTDRRVRIKIFNEKGFSAANIVIPYVSQEYASPVKDVEAIMYSLDDNGNIVTQKLPRSEIVKEKSNAKRSLNSINFTFPGLKKGAVIEYRFSRDEKYSYALSPWFVQETLPTAMSRCTMVMHGFTTLSYYMSPGWIDIEKDSVIKDLHSFQFNKATWNFTARNIPAFKTEPLMRSVKDNLQRIEFSAMPSMFSSFGKAEVRQTEIANYLLGSHDFGKQFDRDIDGSEQFIESIKSDTSELAKVNAVYNYVKQNVTWNKQQDFWCDSVEQCWNDKAGSSGQMNILLLNLLRKAGVDCYPLMVSTRDNGIPEVNFPNLGQFNGVDVFVTTADDKNYILDCTQDLTSKNTPFNILNSTALLIGKNNSVWITIADNSALLARALKVNVNVDSTGNVNGDATSTYMGMAAVVAKQQDAAAKSNAGQYADIEDEHKESSLDFGDTYSADFKIGSSQILVDNSDTLMKNMQFKFSPSSTGSLYFLNPFMFSMLKKNPFIDTARRSDIDFGCNQSYVTTLHFTVADNFSIETTPQAIFIRMQDSSILFRRDVFTNNNEIVIRNSFKLNRANFAASEYSGLKDFFTKVYGLINDELVLKKKN